MKIESNITVMSKGAQEREQIEKTKSNKSGKTIFAGEFEGDFLLQDRIQQKKEQARKQAMKIVSDAWNGDRKIYEEIDKSNTHAADLRRENGEMRSEQNRLKESMEELRKAYGVDPGSEEEKDLELMKKAQAAMNGFAGEALTEEEWAKWNEVSKKERTEYQSRVLELNKLYLTYEKPLADNTREIIGENASVRGVREERRKVHTMTDAQEDAEDVMEAVGDEIIGMVIDDAKEKLEEEKEEREEQAEEIKEEKEKQEELVEERKEREDEVEELIEDLPLDQMSDMDKAMSEMKQKINNILNEMTLVTEDIKGAQVDTSI
ncbi:MAG: hypothetical protein HFH82_07045 [Lachnospiraceae bacterium]|nr:hypothetical protein [Lachnospiraceae bacterium]